MDAPVACRIPAACPGTAVATMASSRASSTTLTGTGTPGDSALHDTQVCSAGYEGNGCSYCSAGFFSVSGRCVPCSGQGDWDIGLRALVAVLLMLVLALAVVSFPARRLVHLLALWLGAQQVSSIGLAGMSSLASLPGSSGADAKATMLFQYLSWSNFDLDIFKPGCSTVPQMDPLVRYWSTVLLMTLTALLFLVALTGRLMVKTRCFSQWRLERKTRRVQQRPPSASASGTGKEGEIGVPEAVDEAAAADAAAAAPVALRVHSPAAVTTTKKKPAFVDDGTEDEVRTPVQDFRERSTHAFLLLLALFYFRMASLHFALFRCVSAASPQSIDSSTASSVVLLHRDDYTTICFGGMHLVTTVFAFLGLLGYIVGFPVLAMTLLCRHLAPIVSGLQRAAMGAAMMGEKAVVGERAEGEGEREASSSVVSADLAKDNKDVDLIDATPGIGGLTGWLIRRVRILRPRPASRSSAGKYKPGAASEGEVSQSAVQRNNFMIEEDKGKDKSASQRDLKSALKRPSTPPTGGLTVQAAWLLYSAAVRQCGVLFVGVKLEQFSYRVWTYLCLLLQAAFIALVYDVALQLFLLALCYMFQALALTWLQPLHSRRNNKWVALLYLLAAAHCGVMMAVQPDIPVLVFPLAGMWVFAALVLYKRARLQKYLAKRWPALVPLRLQKSATSSAAILADGGVSDFLVQKAAVAPKRVEEPEPPRLRRPVRAATLAITGTAAAAAIGGAGASTARGAVSATAADTSTAHYKIRAGRSQSGVGTGDSGSPLHSHLDRKSSNSSGAGNKSSDGEKEPKLRSSVSHSPPSGAATPIGAGTVIESRKLRMPALSPSHHSRLGHDLGNGEGTSSGSDKSPRVGGRSLLPGGVEPPREEVISGQIAAAASGSELRSSISSTSGVHRSRGGSRLLEHAPMPAVTITPIVAPSTVAASAVATELAPPVTAATGGILAMSLPPLPPAPVSTNNSPNGSPRRPGGLDALGALPPIGISHGHRGQLLPPIALRAAARRSDEDEFPEEAKEEHRPVASPSQAGAAVAEPLQQQEHRPDAERADSLEDYRPQLVEYPSDEE